MRRIRILSFGCIIDSIGTGIGTGTGLFACVHDVELMIEGTFAGLVGWAVTFGDKFETRLVTLFFRDWFSH